jgi:hypothetical protein
VGRRRVIVVSFVAGSAVVLAAALFGWGRPPQMGADDEVFTSVDALFTAVTARDENRLGQCEQRLHALQDAGKLPATAAGHLDGIITTARAGRWRPAAERLYDFMAAQRRDGARDRPTKNLKGRGSARAGGK